MRELMLVGLALLPGIALTVYFYRRDVLQAEPMRVIATAFVLGAASVFPAMFVEVLTLGEQPGRLSLAWSVAVSMGLIAPVEEASKLLVIRFYAVRQFHFDELMDGVVYGAAAAAGFATLENVGYVWTHGFAVGILRACLSVPMHIIAGAFMGYWFARIRFTGLPPVRGWGLAAGSAVLIHGCFNAPLLSNLPPATSLVLAGLVVVVAALALGHTMRIALTHDHVVLKRGGQQPAELALDLRVRAGKVGLCVLSLFMGLLLGGAGVLDLIFGNGQLWPLQLGSGGAALAGAVVVLKRI